MVVLIVEGVLLKIIIATQIPAQVLRNMTIISAITRNLIPNFD